MPSPIPQFSLYLVTDRRQTRERDLLGVLERALAGGVKAIQLREKDLGGRELFLLAEKSKRLCELYKASLLVNDRVDVALGVDADGVQLGVGSIAVEEARGLLGGGKLIGVSTHSMKEAKAAEQAGADFLLFGPVYETPSKAVYGEPQGIERLKEVVEKISRPVYAIGGVKAGNIAEVKKSGAAGVALISAVLGAADPTAAAAEIVGLLRR